MNKLTTIKPLPKQLEQWLVKEWKKDFLSDNQPERLSEKTSINKVVYRRSDSLSS